MFNVTPKEIRSKNRKEKQLRVTLALITLLEFWHNLDVTRQKHLKKWRGKSVALLMLYSYPSWKKRKREERCNWGRGATARQNEFPIHPSRHHHSFFRIVATVSRSFCLSKVEKATFVMVVEPERKARARAVLNALNATSSRENWNLSA